MRGEYIRPLETEKILPAHTVEDQRHEIERQRMYDPVVANVFTHADLVGMSKLEIYTRLAYIALASLQNTKAELLDTLRRSVPAPIIMSKADFGNISCGVKVHEAA